MLIAMVNHTLAKNSKVSILNRKQLKHYIDAEYLRFQIRLSKMISDRAAEAKGNAFVN